MKQKFKEAEMNLRIIERELINNLDILDFTCRIIISNFITVLHKQLQKKIDTLYCQPLVITGTTLSMGSRQMTFTLLYFDVLNEHLPVMMWLEFLFPFSG